jgi:hypothetical protein
MSPRVETMAIWLVLVAAGEDGRDRRLALS